MCQHGASARSLCKSSVNEKHVRGVRCIRDPATSHMDVRSACTKKKTLGENAGIDRKPQPARLLRRHHHGLLHPAQLSYRCEFAGLAISCGAEPNVTPRLAVLAVLACPGQGTRHGLDGFDCALFWSTCSQALAASERRFSDSARALSVVRPQELKLGAAMKTARPRDSRSKLRTNMSQLLSVEDSGTSFPAVHAHAVDMSEE